MSCPLQLLSDGIPLTLLLDLFLPNPPDSSAIYRQEGGDAHWLPAA